MKQFVTVLVFFCFCLCSFSEDINGLMSRAEAGNAAAQYELACYYLNNTQSNYLEVLRLLRKSSKQKYEKADRLIKFLLQDGYKSWGDYWLTPQYDFGVISDSQEGEAKKNIIANCNNPNCKGHKGNYLILAHSYFHREEYTLALYYYKEALVQMRKDNLGIKVGEEKMDFSTACMDAYSMLGFCYEHGFGTQKDLQTAIDYYSLGGVYLDEDNASSYDASGVRKILRECNNPDLYEECGDFSKPTGYGLWGNGVYDGFVPSPFALRAWGKSAILYLKMGQYDIAKKLLSFSDVTEDTRINEIGCIKALWIAEMYYKGLGVSVNYQKAYNLFYRIADEVGGSWETLTDEYFEDIYADACYRLYECYTYGKGVDKNEKKAAYYFKEALKNGSTSAVYDDQKRYELSL